MRSDDSGCRAIGIERNSLALNRDYGLLKREARSRHRRTAAKTQTGTSLSGLVRGRSMTGVRSSGMTASSVGDRVTSVHRARVKSRRLRQSSGEPEAPHSHQGTEPGARSHGRIIQCGTRKRIVKPPQASKTPVERELKENSVRDTQSSSSGQSSRPKLANRLCPEKKKRLP
jgi:hypothetical protein